VPPSFFALFFFLGSRSGLVSSSFSSGSSSSFSLFTFSGEYQTGGCEISEGPAGSRAIVKWNAATNVPAGVILHTSSVRFLNRKWLAHVLHFIWLNQPMLFGFLNTYSRALFITKIPDIEREGSSLFLNFGKHCPRCFHLQLICHFIGLLIH
jgi:hypothetical protein